MPTRDVVIVAEPECKIDMKTGGVPLVPSVPGHNATCFYKATHTCNVPFILWKNTKTHFSIFQGFRKAYGKNTSEKEGNSIV